MKSGLSIAVCGAVCHDEIVHLDGHIGKGYGGVLYSVAAFSSVLRKGEAVVPLTILGTDHAKHVQSLFRKLPHVDSRAVSVCETPLTHVKLVWESDSERHETVKGRMPGVGQRELAAVSECAAVHFNFINGTEIGLREMADFRLAYDGLISIDVHQLISSFDDEGNRTITGFPDWPFWAPHVDVWQCNEYEARAIWGPSVDTSAGIRAVAKELLAAGPRVVALTLGPQGAFIAHRVGDEAFGLRIDPYVAGAVRDTTGCGDSFSAGLLTGLLQGDDPVTAAARGVVVAGETACLDGIQPIVGLEEKLRNPRGYFSVFNGQAADWPGESL